MLLLLLQLLSQKNLKTPPHTHTPPTNIRKTVLIWSINAYLPTLRILKSTSKQIKIIYWLLFFLKDKVRFKNE